jgi:copper transport protein
VALGARLYRENCAVCHGPEGRGDGPAAPSLVPRPADLTVHAPMHTDGELFWWITNGLPGTAMPAFRNRLTEPERWHIVNFLRTLTPQER